MSQMSKNQLPICGLGSGSQPCILTPLQIRMLTSLAFRRELFIYKYWLDRLAAEFLNLKGEWRRKAEMVWMCCYWVTSRTPHTPPPRPSLLYENKIKIDDLFVTRIVESLLFLPRNFSQHPEAWLLYICTTDDYFVPFWRFGDAAAVGAGFYIGGCDSTREHKRVSQLW